MKCVIKATGRDCRGAARPSQSVQRYKKACVHTAGPTESDSRTSSLDFPPTLNNNNTSKEIKIGGGTKNIFDADSPTKARQRRGGCFSASEVCELINAGFTQIPKANFSIQLQRFDRLFSNYSALHTLNGGQKRKPRSARAG